MEKLSQEHILNIAFRNSVDREDLLLRKYKDYQSDLKDDELKEMLKEFERVSEENIKALKDKMIKLNIQG